MAVVEHVVTTEWLAANLKRADVKIIDGTWIMPGTFPNLVQGYIPNAQHFDIDGIATSHPDLKHMLPSPGQFENAMDQMGILHSDHVICYDRFGVFSSPRLWWTFKMFGHERVSILDGGLPDWIESDQEISPNPARPQKTTGYEAKSPLIGVISMNDILAELKHNPQIIDARSLGRFLGKDPEPRDNLKSGRIPGSRSMPFSKQIQNGKLKPHSDLVQNIKNTEIDLTKPIITTCGSGVTAAGLAFIFTLLGANDIRVYDGSWSEWGASEAPIEV